MCTEGVVMPHIHLTFPAPLQKELVANIPLRERSRFIAQATEQALQMRCLRELFLSKKNVGTYLEIKPEKWIRQFRKKSRRLKN